MELLAVIHHPHAAIRPAGEIADELAGVYDRVMGMTGEQRHVSTASTTVMLLAWPGLRMAWKSWHDGPRGTLATAGLPLLYSPIGRESAMLTPDRLTDLIAEIKPTQPPRNFDLGMCGGYFAAALIENASHNEVARVSLVTNYLAEVPLYRAGKHGVTVWSNQAAAAAMLAGIPPKLNQRAAVEFLVLSHTLDDRTLFDDVYTEPPGTCIVLKDGNESTIERVSYIDLPKHYFAFRQPMRDAAQETVAAMKPLVRAVRDSGDNFRLHLTGGQDSRAVGAVMRHHGGRVTAQTFHTPNDETASASRLARHLGFAYRKVPTQLATAAQFDDWARTSIWQSDGLMSLKYLSSINDLGYVREHNYIPIEGLGGEYGRGYYFGNKKLMEKLRPGNFTKIIAKAFGQRDALFAHPQLTDETCNSIKEFLATKQASGLDPFQVSTYYYVNQKMRHWAIARRNAGWQWVIDPLQMPCWTYRGMSAAPGDQVEDRLIRAVIDAAWPGTTAVPTQPQLAYRARYRRVATNRLVRNAFQLYDRMKGPMPPPAFDAGLAKLRPHLVEMIRRAEPWMGNLVTAQQADHWLDATPWNYDQTELFWHSATLAAWCEQFLADQSPIRPALSAGAISTVTSTPT